MSEVTDPNILKQLESGPREVTDPALLAQLEGPSKLKDARKFISDYYDYLHQPTEPPTGAGDFLKRVVPDSISKTAVGLAEFPYMAGKSIGEMIQKRGIEGEPLVGPTEMTYAGETAPVSTNRAVNVLAGIGEEGAKNIIGMAKFAGEPFGAFGLEKTKERWTTDPAGSLFAVAPILHAGIQRLVRSKKPITVETPSPEQARPPVEPPGATISPEAAPTPPKEPIITPAPPAAPGSPEFYKAEADRLGVEFKGMTATGLPSRPWYVVFQDEGKAGSFTPNPGETVEQALIRARARYETTKPTAEAGPVVVPEPTSTPDRTVRRPGEPAGDLRAGDVLPSEQQVEQNPKDGKWYVYADSAEVAGPFETSKEAVFSTGGMAKLSTGIPQAKPAEGELFPGQKKEFRLSSTEAPEAAKPFAPAPAEQPLLAGTEKAYKDVGMKEKATDPVIEQVDSLRSILPDFEQGKRLWSQDSREVIGNTPNMYPGWFKDIFRNDSAKEVMATIDKWKEGGDAVLGKKESRIMASVRDLAQDAVKRGEDIGESHWRDLLSERGSVDVTALRPVAVAGQELVDAYRRPPEITESKKIIGRYTGSLQVIDHDLTKVAKDFNRKLSRDRQEAITNYIQAGGDEAVLKERATKGNLKYRKGYQDALTLTSEEKKIAESIRSRQDQTWQLANDAGVIESFVENYVRGEWERPDKAGKKLVAQANSGQFRTKPREALQKVFQDYYEGEQAGFIPKDKRIGYQVIAAERSLKYAIEAKKALRGLMDSKEKDGRPTVAVGGGGNYMGDATGAELPAYYVKPNVLPKEAGDYKYLAHPSLRGWKWVGSDVNGKPILLEGNMWIHPEAFGKVNALLGRSKIREFTVPERVPVIGGTQPGRAALQAGAFIKGTILLGPFHQVHVGLHAVFHKVKPFNLPEIDFAKRPILREGIDHGLMLSNHNAMAEFGEGLASGGLFHRIPGVGTQLIRYQEWLFQNYIPKLKAAMFEHAVDRAGKYYEKELKSGKFTRDQLLENAAKQANAAFGEQNYKYLGRNPTLQDGLRIALLAPDFLEARLKFAGQALRPYGKEQSMALIRGALIMGVTAQTINTLIGDDRKPHWDRPFSIIIGGREYAPRSVVGDMMHLVTDPRSFAYFRLNSLFGRPLVEMASGRDANGRKVGVEDAAKDVLKSWIPIPGQGLVKKNQGDTILGATVNALLQSTGVSNYQYRTDAEKKMLELMPRIDKLRTPEQKRISDLKSQALPMLRKGIAPENLPEGLKKKLGTLTDKQAMNILKDGQMTSLQSGFKHLSAVDSIEVWKKMTPQERGLLGDDYKEKLARKAKDMSDEDYEAFKKLIAEAEK